MVSKDQSDSISQVNTSLRLIDKDTKQNNAYAEEASSAAEELSSQASQVRKVLSKFKLKKRKMLL